MIRGIHAAKVLTVLISGGLLSQLRAAQPGGIQPSRPYLKIIKEAVKKTDAVVLASAGRATLFNDATGISGAVFLDDVYKSFGLSADSRYFLYLKARNGLPTFTLYLHDLTTGEERPVTGVAVHYAAWAPTGNQLAYIWLDSSNKVHLSHYDVASGVNTEIASGRLEMDYLAWSQDGAELLYVTVEPQGNRAFETHQYASSLHRYSLQWRTKITLAGVGWGQFHKGRLVVTGKTSVAGYTSIPNPQKQNIRRFAIVGESIYADILENEAEVIKRWNAGSNSYEYVTGGRLISSNERGIVVQEFTRAGVGYKYVVNGSVAPLTALPPTTGPALHEGADPLSAAVQNSAAAGTNWKLPYHGLAELVQGGLGYQDGSCDGTAACYITAHVFELSYALDFQQAPEKNQGNIHMLAVEAGTVAAITNNVTCSSNPSCSSSWDTYDPNCNDPNGGAANYVSIAHIDGTYSFYAHLKSGSVQVVPGQAVSQGTYLADQGHSGGAATYNNYHVCGDHLHFSRQISPVVWSQTIPTDFTEAPCLMGCTSIYTSSNVEIAPAPTLVALQPATGATGTSIQVKLTGTNFLYGSTVNVSGTGVTVSNTALASSTEINATFTIAANATAGTRNISVTTVSGTSNTVSFTVTAPVQVILATQPTGLTLTADGSACTAPCTFQWSPGSSHTIASPATQPGGTGVQYVWSNWSDGGALSHTIIAPSTTTTYRASFATQYLLTTQASPAAGGSITPASGWYAGGSSVTINAAPSAGYNFTGFTGDLNGSSTPQNITLNAPATVTANFIRTGGNGAAWYSTGGTWGYRKALNIDRTKISGSTALTDFPMLVSVTDTDLRSSGNGGRVGKLNGGDILFADSDGGTKLDHEVESYDPVTGKLVAWVRIPSLSPAADTVIYIYYGNSAASDQQNATGVWDTNFKGVWHLGVTSGTTVSDSTTNANHGTKSSASIPAAGAGQIGGGQLFSGDSTGITVPDSNSLDATTAVTISAWIKANSWPNNSGDAVLNKEGNYGLRSGDNAAAEFDLLWWNTSGQIRVARTTPPVPGVWHYVVGQANAGDAYRVYVDGVQVSSAPFGWVSDARRLTGVLTIGTSVFDPGFNGSIDEVRVSNAARTSDWIVTEYRNQSAPGTFFAVGVQESAGTSSQVASPTFSPAAGSYTGTQNVTLATTTAGASIRYTIDGTTPTSTTGLLYSGPVVVSSTATLRAIAYKTGMTDSAVSTATYTITLATTVTVTTSPSGQSLLVDGTACTAPCVFQWAAGSSHTIATTSPQAGATGVQYVWSSWSDGGALSHTITAPATATTYTASFVTQYYLTTQASPSAGGTIGPASGWYDSGASVAVSATANAGYTFSGFAGGLSGTTTPQNVVMNAPVTVTANFTSPSSITVTSAPAGRSLSVDGVACTAPCVFQWTAGSSHTIATTSPQAGGTGVQYVWSSWSDGGALSHTITAPATATTYTASFVTQYYLTTQASPSVGGTIAPASGWYDSGASVAVSATANAGYTFSGFAGGLSGTTTPQNVTMNAPVTVTANFTAPSAITVTSAPAGRSLSVDGVACTAPCVFQWTAGSSHTIATTSPQAGGTGVQYVWSSWSDGGALSHTITAPATATTYTASFVTQYYLTTQASPSAGGTIGPASGWYDSGASVAVSATANAGYTFSGFAGGLSGTTTPQNVTMNGPVTVTANFTAPSAITVTSAPAGRSLTVDGVACTAPCVFQWTAGSSHTIATTSPQAGGTGVQYVWSSWSDGGALSHTITAPATATTYTASFVTQYYLTTQASPSAGGIISPASGWYNSGASVAVSATANSGYTFSGFSGGLSGTTTPQNVSMNAPVTVTANFTASSAITVTSAPAGRSLTVDGAACTSPCVFQWTAGSSHTIATTSPQAGATGVQYVWSSWSDGGALSHTITAPATATTYTASFVTQYYLTTQASPSAGGTIAPASGWYNSGASVAVSATANSGYTFSGFSGGLTGTTTPQNVTMNAPVNVTANFTVNGVVPWYSTGGTWIHRKRLTVDHTKVSGSAQLTNFPILISVTDPDLRSVSNGGSVGKINGGDILYTASDGTTKLNHEVESYDPVSGKLVAWVRIPSLSPTADTVIYVYYGNSAASDQQNATGVWDTNFKGVWHLGATSGTTISDSTTNANHGTKSSASIPAAGTGQIGGGQLFSGDSTGITVPDSNSLDATTAVTISAWIKANSWPNNSGDAVLNKEGNYGLRSGDNAASEFDLLWWNTSGQIRVARTTPPVPGVWHYVVGQANAGDAYRVYVDGVQVSSAPFGWAPDARKLTGVLTIGTSVYDPGFSGSIDEVRVSNTARTSDWIVTEYRNQSSPGTFVVAGAQE